ncbi:hypothetical protein Glove_365g176 [Diversispora epigaea]|uniref:BZIP domain-containing protein n=1 Tax=Diversispora epigaea TaxID=1348612 RepID=A0A397H912_9GLOM|nr:hypothetical protein Glove_365g176 [Diversispora epigaea]
MVYGICPECNQKCNGHWCNPCNSKMILIIGRLNANGWKKVLECILYDRFKDVKQIGKGRFGTIHLLELSDLSLEQTFCNESFSFINDLTIQDTVSDDEIENQAKKRNRGKYEGGEGEEGEEGEKEDKEEGGEKGEGSSKRSRKDDGKGEEELEKINQKRESDRKSASRYREKKKNEAEKLKQQVNDLEEKNKLLKNKVNELSKEFLELRDFVMIHIICYHL